jgi:hypothetical protein
LKKNVLIVALLAGAILLISNKGFEASSEKIPAEQVTFKVLDCIENNEKAPMVILKDSISRKYPSYYL